MLKKQKKIVKFITYDGIIEPIGKSQVLSYVKKLSHFYSIKILSYEKHNDLKDKIKVKNLQKELLKLNISWKALRYNNYFNFGGTIHNILRGMIDNLIDLIFKNIIFFHIRGPLPGLLIIPFLNFFKIKFIFDMRGFWADEKHDRLGWEKKSFKYRLFKGVEKKLLNSSNYIICLTKDAKEIIIKDFKISSKKIMVLPTCVDTDYFIRKNKDENKFIQFCHFGSTESAYNIEKTLKLFSFFLKIEKKIKIIFFTKQETNKLKKLFIEYNIPNDNYEISSLNRNEIVKNLNDVDIGIFYCNKNFSIKGSYPTKIGEFLACGIPILCNDFNNEITELINKNKVGLISSFSENNYLQIYQNILEIVNKDDVKKNCRKVAETELSLNIGVQKIKKIYDMI